MKLFPKITLLFLFSICFSCSENKKEQAKKVEQKTEELTQPISFKEIDSRLIAKQENFEFSPRKKKTVKTKRGAKVTIPKDAFVFEDGTKPSKPVNFSVKESFTFAEMIGDQLSTTSGNQILETAGMLKIEATSEGKKLKMKNGKNLKVEFPKQKNEKGFGLFYLSEFDDGSMSWTPAATDDAVSNNVTNDYTVRETDNTTSIVEEASLGEFKPTYIIEETIVEAGTFIRIKQDTPIDDIAINYPEEYYSYDISAYSYERFHRLKFKNLKVNPIAYINDSLNNKFPEICKRAIKEEWVLYTIFNINSKGKMVNFRPLDGIFSKQYYKDLDVLIDWLKRTPAINTKDYNKPVRPNEEFYIGFSINKIFNYKKYNERNRKEEMKKLKSNAKKSIYGLEKLVYNVNQLGWINCDRFYNTKSKKLDLFVTSDDPGNSRVYILFADINSMMSGYKTREKFTFNNIPENSKINIIGVKQADNKVYIQTIQTTLSMAKSDYLLNNFEEISIDELETKINSLQLKAI